MPKSSQSPVATPALSATGLSTSGATRATPSTGHHLRRRLLAWFYATLILCTGSLAVLLGAMVLVGWYTHNVTLLQIVPTFAPMQYNTALGLVACGIGVLALLWSQTRLAAGCSVIVTMLGLLTLSEYLLQVDLGIDQLLMQHFISGTTPYPGRIAPNTALCFVLAGVTVWSLRRAERQARTLLLTGLAGATVLGLGLVACFGYLVRFKGEYGWEYLSDTSVHAAVGCVLLGIGLTACVWRQGKASPTWIVQWCLTLGGVSLVTTTICLWQALVAEEAAHIMAATRAQAASVQNEITARMDSRIMPLVRMARTWERRGKPEKDVWASEAELYMNDYSSSESIVWIDPSFRVRWVVPVSGNEAAQDLDLSYQERQRQTLEFIGDSRTAMVTRALGLSQDMAGFQVSVPVFAGDALDGFILGAFRLQKFLDTILENVALGYGITVFDDKEEIYRRASAGKPYERAWGHKAGIDLYGMKWHVRVWPTRKLLTEKRSFLPDIILSGGLTMAALLTMVGHVAYTARLRSRQTTAANRELQLEIAERRRAEEALARLSRQNQLILDAAGEGIYGLDVQERTTFVNPAAARMLGWDVEELLGHAIPVSPAPSGCLAARVAHGTTPPASSAVLSPQVTEDVFCRKDGTRFPVEYVRTPIREGDLVVGTVVVFRDISERKQAAEQLQRQQEALFQREKLATMGSLLASVAHELNNPLAIVMMQADLLQEEAAGGVLAERATKITQAAERSVRIVKNFLALVRQRSPERSAVRLNEVVETVMEMLTYPLEVDTIQVTLQLDADLPTLWADPHQLQQVVLNLLTNAHQALQDVTTPRRLTLTTQYQAAQSCVCLTVTDTGIGMPQEVQERIFEPFFTTKPPGTGTGLGLSLCQGIIESHGGQIRVESQPGAGTSFHVTLPVEALPPALLAPPVPETLTAVPACSILVVDDEPGITGALAYLLRRDGHRVDTAPNGRVALAKLQEQTYDLVLSDVRMPELDGVSLYHELEQHYPAMMSRIIFLTGDTLNAGTAPVLDQVGVPRLHKPFNASEVRRVIQRVLQVA